MVDMGRHVTFANPISRWAHCQIGNIKLHFKGYSRFYIYVCWVNLSGSHRSRTRSTNSGSSDKDSQDHAYLDGAASLEQVIYMKENLHIYVTSL